jgi:DNA invertase Pin-like site-specific DNA recombinase
MKVKYNRVSTIDQNLDRQDNFKGLTYADKCSGSVAFADRTEASKLLANEEVTEVLVTSICRLGRNTIDIMQTIQFFTNKGINIISEKEGLQTIVDGKENPVAKMMIGKLGTLAEFELTRIKERQSEGIAKAKEKGTYVGRSKGSSEDIATFTNKKSTQAILRYLKQGYSINKTALLSETSTGSVKKVKKMIKEGMIAI